MLKHLDDSLASEDLVVLKFLCRDIIKLSKIDDIKTPLDLFDQLGEYFDRQETQFNAKLNRI